MENLLNHVTNLLQKMTFATWLCAACKNVEKLQLLSDSKLNKQLRKWYAFIVQFNRNYRSIVCFMYFKYEGKKVAGLKNIMYENNTHVALAWRGVP